MWNDFREFIARGSVVDLAIGVIIGAAFGRIVTALVEGVMMPPLGLVLGRVDFSSLFLLLDSSQGVPASLADAKAKGIPVVAYGQFINEIVSFVIIAAALFIVIRQVNRLKRAPAPVLPQSQECRYCASTISVKATRCPNCTSQLA